MASGFYLIALVCLTTGLWINAAHAESCKACPTGWTPFGDHCYAFHFSHKDWADAEVSCVKLGGNLASVHSKEQYDFLKTLIRTLTGGDPQTWVGGYDAVKEGVWLWSDGSSFADFKFWGPTQPSNYRGMENCMELNWRGAINDIGCNARLHYVCGMRL
ncbi:galactose-specific lectin nattectin-like [Halichoeres trimaculatus]|uniref:galactose-specific lectin nattectin-like n=1 Tax=Halichoeres trimaculatus TaxID=147232 RepID=UPI003D9DF4F9